MPPLNNLLVFAGASLLLLIIPGPAVTYIVARSIAQGRKAGLLSVLGIHVGSIVHVVAAVAGISALIASSAFAYHSVRIGGAAYLIFLGVTRILNKKRAEDKAPEEVPMKRVFVQGIVVNVLNPKTSLFFLAFLPQFVDPTGNVALQTFFLGMMFILLGALSDSTYALLASSFANLLRKSRTFIAAERWVSGGIFIALGLTAALSGHRPERT